ncbi:MAG: M16 family metallopeptidase, partial [Candidatus Flemingiibacterium sp.]
SGLTLADPEYPALMLCNAIYGGAVTSKLFMNVREKMSLCYYCQSSPDAVKGLLMIQSGIEVSNREVAEKAILEQLEAVRRGDFTDEEMNGALLFLINSYNELADSARGLENWYLGRMIFNIPGEPDEMVEKLRAVTREDIIAAAKLPTLDTVYFLNGTLCGEDEEDENA